MASETCVYRKKFHNWDQDSNLNGAVCISQSANTLGGGMDLTNLSPAMGKLLVRLIFLTLVW